MGRLNVEENAWRRINNLARIMKCSDREAAGTLTCLWADSQDVNAESGTRDEIADWAHLFDLSDVEVGRWIEGLVRARFLKLLPDGSYSIKGNDVQIQSRDQYLNRTAKATEAAKAKRDRERALLAQMQTQISVDESVTDPSRIRDGSQCNSMQCNSNQSSEETPPAKRAPRADRVGVQDCIPIFEAYPLRDNTGKSKGLDRLARDMKRDELELAIRAARNYAAYVEQEKRSQKDWRPNFVKQFATWTGEWRDWIDWKPKGRSLTAVTTRVPEKLSDDFQGWHSATVDAIRAGGRGIREAIEAMPPDLGELVELSFGTWRMLPPDQAERESLLAFHTVQRSRSRSTNLGGSA